MKKLIVLIMTLMFFALPSIANAQTSVFMGSGQKIVMGITPDPSSAFAQCTMAAVGYDKFNNKVGLTAGHCGKVGTYAFDANGLLLGRFETSKQYSGIGILEWNVLDYAFIKFNDNVVMQDFSGSPQDIKRIVSPSRTQFPVCKYGYGVAYGINNQGERCGFNVSIRPLDFSTTVFVNFGDSGGGVYVYRNELIGIVSRPAVIPYLSASIMTRADAAVTDATNNNLIGAGFRPVA